MKKNVTQKSQRRSFLKSAAVAGTAVGAGAVTAESLADIVKEPSEPVAKKGYQESDHIREYYRLARF